MKIRNLSLLWAGVIVTILSLLNGCGKRLPTTVDEGQGYQRTLLVEVFTSEFCTNCPKADAAAESLAAEMGDSLCLVELHPKAFQSSGDSLGLAEADTLVAGYEAGLASQGLPFFSCDGIENILGTQSDVSGMYQEYRQKADLRKLIKSPLEISLTAWLDQDAVVYSAQINSDASLPKDADLGLVLLVVEDSVNAYGKAFRYVARSFIPNTNGNPLVIQPASSISKAGTIARNTGWLPWRLSLIAYVRNNDTKEILQAAKVRIIAATTTPATPVLSLPANYAVGQSLNPTLSWLASSGAASYTLHLATDSLFNNLIQYPSGLNATSVILGGLINSTTYYWRVNASNNAGTSNWSSWRSFTTTATSLPGAPTLVSPASGDTGISKSPALSWNTSSGALSYGLQAATSNSFYPASLIFSQTNLTGTSQELLDLDPATVYYWRINAFNDAGGSAWSETRSFTTTVSPAPEAPGLLSPANWELNAGTNPVLKWSSCYGAVGYRLQVSPNHDFRNAALDQGGLTDTSQAFNGIDSLTTYYWRANASNNFGASAWSEVWNFTDARGYGFSRVITPDSTVWLPDTIISYSLSHPEPPELGYHIYVTNLSSQMTIYAQAPSALNSDSLLFWGYLCSEANCYGPDGVASALFKSGTTQHWTVHFNFNTLPPPEGLHWLTLKLWAADNPSHIMIRKLYLEVLP